MNNNIQIYYNGINLFSGIAPTPFITFNQEFINFNTGWNQVTTMTMNGQITGRYLGQLSYYELTSGLNLLVSKLSNNYGSLVIQENSQDLFSGNNVIIDSITTDQNSLYGVLPFTINCQIYETELFSNYYGVLNPEENINFSEENGFIVNLTHNISAQGIKTGGINAIENAKNWVKTRTGNYNKVIPIFIRTGNGSNFLLTSSKESVDRFNGIYKWEGTYVKSTFIESPENAILNYTIDLSSGIDDGLVTVKIDGSLTNNNITGSTSNNLRSGYLNYNFYNIANESSLKTFGTTLNSKPISQSVTEEQNNQVLNFNLSYNNDLLSNIINNYYVDIDTDSLKNITKARLTSRIFAKYGDISTRWNLVKNYYTGNFNPFSLINTEYKKEISNKILYSRPLIETIIFNEYNAEIQYDAEWSDKRIGYSDDVITMESNITYKPSINIYTPNTSTTTSREHNIQNLGCATRAGLSITVSATAKPNKNINIAIKEVEDELNRIKNNYNIINNRKYLLENRNIKKNSANKYYGISEEYSYNGDITL